MARDGKGQREVPRNKKDDKRRERRRVRYRLEVGQRVIVAEGAKYTEFGFAVDDGRASYGDLGSEDDVSQRPSGTQSTKIKTHDRTGGEQRDLLRL